MDLFALEVVFPRLGCDEVGKGDFFGPLVAAGAIISEKSYTLFNDICDSKRMSDKRILSVAPGLMKQIPHSVVKIGPARYNDLYDRFKNINAILGWAHSRVILNLLEAGHRPQAIVIDQFGPEFRVMSHLKDAPIEKERIHFFTKAEVDRPVAGASVIARYVFLKEMELLGQRLGTPLPLGAGSPVDLVARSLYQKSGPTIFREYAKIHFKNFQKLL